MCRVPGLGAEHPSGRDIVPTDRRPSFVRRAATVAALTVTVASGLLTGSGLAAAAPPTTRVTNADLGTAATDCNFAGPTGYCTELNGGGTAAVVDDSRANLGRGYLRLSTPSSSAHATVFAQQQFAGKKLSDLTTVAFESFIEHVGTANAQIAPSINIQINPHKTGNTSIFTTLVWEPINAHLPVVAGTWQQWTPSATPNPGGWWATGTTSDVGPTNRYGFTNYTATFAQIKTALPDATIYQVGVNQGSGSTGLIAGVDQLRLNNTTYDFDNGPLVADLGLAIAAPATAQRGTTITVTVTVTNRGRLDTRNVDTAVVFSPGLRVVSAPGGFGFGSVAAYRTGQLGTGAPVSYVITLAVDAKARGSLTAFGSVHSPVPDPYTLNNVAGASIAVTNRP
jgi:Domain of unknown function DUF11